MCNFLSQPYERPDKGTKKRDFDLSGKDGYSRLGCCFPKVMPHRKTAKSYSFSITSIAFSSSSSRPSASPFTVGLTSMSGTIPTRWV